MVPFFGCRKVVQIVTHWVARKVTIYAFRKREKTAARVQKIRASCLYHCISVSDIQYAAHGFITTQFTVGSFMQAYIYSSFLFLLTRCNNGKFFYYMLILTICVSYYYSVFQRYGRGYARISVLSYAGMGTIEWKLHFWMVFHSKMYLKAWFKYIFEWETILNCNFYSMVPMPGPNM